MGELQLPGPPCGPVMGLYRDYFTFIIVYNSVYEFYNVLKMTKLVQNMFTIIKYIIYAGSV